MTILCGTDFSELGQNAATVAAQLALRAGQPLQLTHVLGFAVTDAQEPTNQQQLRAAEQGLASEAARVRRDGLVVTTCVRFGSVASSLLEQARELDAKLLVLGAHAGKAGKHAHVGSSTETVAAAAGVPVLVVRDTEPFTSWDNTRRPLRVVLGADNSATTDAAMSFITKLCELGSCELLAVHLFWPPEQFERLGFSGSRNYLEVDPALRRVLTEELARRIGKEIPVLVEPHLGNLGERLVTVAANAHADLIVTGSHGRLGVSRLWHGSVSRDVLHNAHVAVACVPSLSQAEAQESTRFRSALVGVDFSELSPRALTLACTAVQAAGTIHLVHVVKPRTSSVLDATDIFAPAQGAGTEWQQAQLNLERLADQQRTLSSHQIACHVLESQHPADAIAQAAERLQAELICLGTHNRRGAARAILGSTAERVLAHTRRPVLLTQTPDQ